MRRAKPTFYDPRDVQKLYAAVDQARLILNEAGVSADRHSFVDRLLASAVLRAAQEGHRDLARLTRAACEQWVAWMGSVDRNASRSVH